METLKPRTKGVVTITIPATVATSPEHLNELCEEIAVQCGCRTCFSGRDCYLTQATHFTVDESRKAYAESVSETIDSTMPVVEMVVPSKVMNDINLVKVMVKNVFGRCGCVTCTSGFETIFRESVDNILNVGVDGQLVNPAGVM